MTWVFVDPDELDDIARQLRGIAAALDRVPGVVHSCCRCAVSCSIGGYAQQVQSSAGYAVRSAADGMVFHASDLDRRANLARQALGTAYAAAVSPATTFTAASATSGPGVTPATSTPTLRQLLYPTTTSIGGSAGAGWSIVAAPSAVPAATYGSTMTIGGNTSPGFAVLPGAGATTLPTSGGLTTLGGNAGGFAVLPGAGGTNLSGLYGGMTGVGGSWSPGPDVVTVVGAPGTVASGVLGQNAIRVADLAPVATGIAASPTVTDFSLRAQAASHMLSGPTFSGIITGTSNVTGMGMVLNGMAGVV